VVGLLNDLERTFPGASFFAKLAILCCSPLAVCIGLASMAGMIGSGLLGGLAVGRLYGCPITGAWIGMCLAVIVLAIEGSIFWPLYFPLTRHEGE
jgi:hypothetical protein